MKRTGRPSIKTDEKIQTIIENLKAGIPLAQICRTEGMPAACTVRDWMAKDSELSLAIARAREDGEEVIAANCRRVARGEEGYSTGDVQRDKLVIYTDLQLLAKWNPKKYGERVALTGDAENPIQQRVEIEFVDGPSK